MHKIMLKLTKLDDNDGDDDVANMIKSYVFQSYCFLFL